MELEIRDLEVSSKSLRPEFLISIGIKFEAHKEIPFLVSGILYSDSGKEISTLIEHPDCPPDKDIALHPIDQITTKSEGYLKLVMKCELNEFAINHIEETRHRKSDKDVILQTRVYIKYFTTTFKTRPTHAFDLVNFKTKVLIQPIKITQSDWIKDYAKKLNIGSYLLLELPEISLDRINSRFNNYLKPDALGNLKEKMIKSLGILEAMKSFLEKGDWDSVMKQSREFFELFKLGKKNPIEPELRKIFIDRNGTDVGFQDFYDSIHHMFEYSSKYIHEFDKSKNLHLKPKAKGEDAYFALSFCINILNSLVHKV